MLENNICLRIISIKEEKYLEFRIKVVWFFFFFLKKMEALILCVRWNRQLKRRLKTLEEGKTKEQITQGPREHKNVLGHCSYACTNTF